MASPDSVPVDIVRKRSEKAVEYYKTRVVPKYPTRPGTASPVRVQNYDSVENINGIYTSHKAPTGRHIDSSRKGKSQVGFEDNQNRKSSDKHNDSFTRGGHRATIHGTNASKSWKQSKSRGNKEKRSPKSPSSPESGEDSAGFKRRSRGLYRSNSNLEMDSIEYVDIDDFHNTSLIHRDYGSTSSLDVLGTSSDSFFAMLKDYGVSNLDQRSPAPDKLQEVLRGRLDSNKERDSHRSAGKKVSNGLVPSERANDDNVDSPRSKSKFKSKDRKSRAKSITSENRPGIFTKLRGKPEAESGARTPDNIDMDLRAEERQRWKAFVHLDCQSMGFDLQTVIKNQKSESSIASKNTSTGASAASGQNRNSYAADKDGPDIIADTDDGDGKSNDLVLSCPFFRNEIGCEEERSISLGRTGSSNRKSQQSQNTPLNGAILLRRSPACCGVSILDSLPTPTGLILPHVVLHRGHVMEYVDHGASYYRHFFYGYDHQNYFGVDETLGPVAVSFRKEKVEDRENNLGKSDYGYTQYRILFRTSELTTLRGTVIEDAIPSSASRLGGSRTTTVKDVLEFAVPELQTSCLKTALSTQKTLDQLMKLDEQGVNTTYKVGVMYCKTGQSSEEDMYNNEHSGPAFEEFLSCIGQKVRLKGFEKYRAQLDNKTDSTGTYSLYTTFNNSEMMFHVSTMLPFTPNNQQQLLRKRHIGNDIVTIVFQEPGALPFTPKTVRSQFQHVFIIVRAHNPCTDNVHYSIAVSRSKDVPPFGPHIPENALFPRGPDFADFLLAKIINAENAAHRCEKFCAMATRTRTEYLKDLAMNYVTSTTLDSGSKLSKFALGSGRKKDRAKQKVTPDVYATGAVVWSIQVEDFGSASQVDGILGISAEVLVILEETSKDVIFTVHCGAIIGWTPQANSIRIYFNQGENVLVRPQSGEMEETDEICTRLKAITPGWESQEMTLKRNGMGQLGFHIQSEGIVTDVEKHGFAWEAGLRKGSRLVEICKAATATLTHEQMVDLLRTSVTVKVTVIPPMDDGTPRGVATLHTNCHYSSLTTLKAACQATENVQQRQKEALLNRKSSEGEINHRELFKTSSDSSEYAQHQREISNMINSSMEHLNMLFMRKDASKVSLGSTEQIYQHQREVSQLSNSSSEQGHQLKDSMTSFSTNVKELTIQLQRRDSARMSSSSSEYNASPTQREPSKGLIDMTDQRGSLTLPLQRKPSTPTRGDIKLPQSKCLTPQYRQMGTSSLQRGVGLHHAYTDSSLSAKSSGSYDEGYSSKHTTAESVFRVEDVRHERSGSRDSADYAYLSMAGTRQWNPRSSQNQGNPKWQDSNSSGDSSSYGSHLHMSESTPSMMSLQSNAPSSGYSRKHSAPGGDYSAPQHGNIALELLKQTQNSKYLLSQGQEHGKNGSSSVNLSDTSFSSGSSQNSGTLPGQRGHGDPIYFGNPSKEDTSVVARKRADISSTNSRGRPVGHVYRKTHLDISPLSSENSSPRSSHRNLSGMSSEESLNTRLRPGVTGKPTKSQSNDQLQEELKCLINLNINNTELRGILSQSEKPPSRLKRTMSDESIHSQKGVTSSKSLNNNLADVIFTSAPPVPALPKEVLQDQRLSPRAMLDSEMAAKARQILSRHSASTQNNNNNNNNVPLPESAASLDWSNLVNVATKAIEGSDNSTSKSQNSLSSDKKESQPNREVPPRDSSKKSTIRQPPNKDVPMKRNTAPVGPSSGNSVWRSTVSNPQQRIQELEAKVEQLEADLDKERKENAALEAEVQELRQENARLQEESQTAAAQLRKFTEWFFQTIDRQ